MGAGILPTTIYNNKIYFLFGKENRYEDSASGFSDFGGGTDNKETYFQTAIREGTEELTGFLGSPSHLKNMLKKTGYYPIDYKSDGYSNYRCHIFPYHYDERLPYYYNNNQQFIQKHLDSSIIKETKIFEKEKIEWFCIDDLLKRKKEFRSYFQNIIDIIHRDKDKILVFLKKAEKEKEKYFYKPTFIKTRKNRKNK